MEPGLLLLLLAPLLLGGAVMAARTLNRRRRDLLARQGVTQRQHRARHLRILAVAVGELTGDEAFTALLYQLAEAELATAGHSPPKAGRRPATARAPIARAPLPGDAAGLEQARRHLREASRLLAAARAAGHIDEATARRLEDVATRASRAVALRLDLRQAAAGDGPTALPPAQ